MDHTTILCFRVGLVEIEPDEQGNQDPRYACEHFNTVLWLLINHSINQSITQSINHSIGLGGREPTVKLCNRTANHESALQDGVQVFRCRHQLCK